MLFNSPEFLFLFLPLTLAAFLIGQRIGGNVAIFSLAIASFFFYGWWDPLSLPILLSSIVINWYTGEIIGSQKKNGDELQAKIFCGIGITANLILLIYYKYSGFFVNDVYSYIAGEKLSYTSPTLPIGVSFFTFTQIAYLIDVYAKKTKKFSPLHYALFVNYFPHLIAGPILHHANMMPQFEIVKGGTKIVNDISIGGGILLIGLAKKLLLADPLGGYVNTFYANLASSTVAPGFIECLLSSVAYSLQLYFDFSGYSDMAIGISRMFGIDLPINFNSPYKSVNIIEFWRRWHISLSNFLRDYLYIPLGGSRLGPFRRFVNLFLTMLLGGLWHGAGWTFVLWGGIHGTMLIINHGFRAMFKQSQNSRNESSDVFWKIGSTALTFAVVTVAWIPFRAPNIESSIVVISGLFGQHGVALPSQILSMAPFLKNFVVGVGNLAMLADGTVMGFIELSVLTIIGLGIAFLAPNSQEMSHKLRLMLGALFLPLIAQKILFGGKVEFLYFQF